MREFVGIELAREPVPDATTLLKFRRLLEDLSNTGLPSTISLKRASTIAEIRTWVKLG